MLVRLADYIGERERELIMTFLEWKPGQREHGKSTQGLLFQMESYGIFSEKNVDNLIECLKSCQLMHALSIVENYRSTMSQQEQTARTIPETQGDHPQSTPTSQAPSSLVSAIDPPIETRPFVTVDTSQGASTSSGSSGRAKSSNGVKKVFISFSHRSMTDVMAIKGRLERDIGDRCWIYASEVLPGDNIYERIAGAMSDAAVVLLMMNQDYVDSDECEKEVFVANNFRKPCIPVMLQDMGPSLKKKDGTVSSMNMMYAGRWYCKLYATTEEEREQNVAQLVESILNQIDLEEERSE